MERERLRQAKMGLRSLSGSLGDSFAGLLIQLEEVGLGGVGWGGYDTVDAFVFLSTLRCMVLEHGHRRGIHIHPQLNIDLLIS